MFIIVFYIKLKTRIYLKNKTESIYTLNPEIERFCEIGFFFAFILNVKTIKKGE